MNRRFLVVSGLPGSGKSTLAARLAALVSLPVIDKDDILDRLLAVSGMGDDTWRRTLSRESDDLFQRQAEGSDGAILVSFWHLPGMPMDSGTPMAWVRSLSATLVHLHCVCDVATAARRFAVRSRHPGHLDRQRSPAEILDSLKKTAALGPPAIGTRIDVDTTGDADLEALVSEINRAWTRT